MILHTIDQLNALLAGRAWWANGKNAPVEHLYETVAASRWPYENLLGVYLTNAAHAWMAVWIAVTRRDRLKKRQLRYVRPRADMGDAIGRIEIFDPAGEAIRGVLCENACLHLVDPRRFDGLPVTDVAGEEDRTGALERHGFRLRTIERRGWRREGYEPPSPEPRVVRIDAWQVAVVNTGPIVPDQRVVLTTELIDGLADRASRCAEEIGEAYIA